jgi:hypothetical protein
LAANNPLLAASRCLETLRWLKYAALSNMRLR